MKPDGGQGLYLGYWRLQRKPFENTDDPRFLYLGASHREALARLNLAARERKEGMVLVGDHGTGKTFLKTHFLAGLAQHGDFAVASLAAPSGSAAEIMADLVAQINGREPSASRMDGLRSELRRALDRKRRRGLHGVVAVDPVAFRPASPLMDVLDTLRGLGEGAGVTPLSLCLFAPEGPGGKGRDYFQRLPLNWRLSPLDEKETRAYIQFRLKAGGGNEWIFDDEAVALLYKQTGGNPRAINDLCDLALLVGMQMESVKVQRDTMEATLNCGARPCMQEVQGMV